MMILAALALALQAAPAPAVTPAPAVHPAVNGAGETWAQCTRRVVDAGVGSTRTDAELAADAFAGCSAEEAALRAAVVQHNGADAVERFMTEVTEDARITLLHYLRRTRHQH